ncbi:hypothetical protein MTR_8g011155 [Medicago truncatula]|uniref:Uncharacterized protein n=1 Tax=Medicago truncatula TaxID=3880 RepID=A0A072TLI7_MEDTR|nr:hypothetical protein MTR_8g011155 [Medicago truncatula]
MEYDHGNKMFLGDTGEEEFVTYNQISAIKETILMHKHTFLPSFPLLLSLTFATLGSKPMGRSN